MKSKIEKAIEIYKLSGGHFFDKDTLEYWGSVIESDLYEGNYFITSEYDFYYNRKYSIRKFVKEFTKIETIGNFLGFITKQDAVNELNKILQN